MRSCLHLFVVSAAAALLSACQTTGSSVETAATSVAMPPVESRPSNVGDTFVYKLHTGEERSGKVVSKTGDQIRIELSDGCSYSAKRDGFAPNPEWSNCGGSSGTQQSKRVGESIFPMTIGSSESWEYSGTNNKGNSWASTRSCTVPKAVSVTVPAGTFDAYHVRCEDKWWVREWYVNAEGITVLWSRTIKTGSADRNRSGELVSYNQVDA